MKAAIALLALLISACGGSSGGEVIVPPPPVVPPPAVPPQLDVAARGGSQGADDAAHLRFHVGERAGDRRTGDADPPTG